MDVHKRGRGWVGGKVGKVGSKVLELCWHLLWMTLTHYLVNVFTGCSWTVQQRWPICFLPRRRGMAYLSTISFLRKMNFQSLTSKFLFALALQLRHVRWSVDTWWNLCNIYAFQTLIQQWTWQSYTHTHTHTCFDISVMISVLFLFCLCRLI